MEQVFEVKSGEVLISDPCYRDPTFTQARLTNIRKGRWVCGELTEGEKTFLEIRHRDIVLDTPKLKWEEIDGDLASESGLIGIFDIFEFKPRDESWFRKCCDLTKNCKVGILPKGCVTNTMLHEGPFEFYLARHPEKRDVVAIKVSL